MTVEELRAVQATALQFAQALTQRDYTGAYALTSYSYQQQISIAQIQEVYERIIPENWGKVDLVPVDDVLEGWPDKQLNDIGWIYISLEGQNYPYSEGLFICISRENGNLIISDVTYGR